jgi:hypothetical protein
MSLGFRRIGQRHTYMNAQETILKVPPNFGFKDHDLYDFDKALSFFDWSFSHENICIDFTSSARANYQCLALLVPYIWKLRCQGCHIETMVSQNREDTSKMWRLMGAVGWSQVLGNKSQNFRGHAFKPLIAIRSQPDFSMAMSKAEQYTKGFNVEYEKTLRYVISEVSRFPQATSPITVVIRGFRVPWPGSPQSTPKPPSASSWASARRTSAKAYSVRRAAA